MSELVAQLEQATQGLFFPSESDDPVAVFVWKEQTPFSPQALLTALGLPEDTPIDETNIDRFFRPVTTKQSWHTAEDQARVQRFTDLVALLKHKLHDLHVYKIGKITRDVYIVGQDDQHNTVGITTKVVET